MFKYPRTYHLPYSLGKSDDDKVLKAEFSKDYLVSVTEKLDGENVTFTRVTCHSRSLDGKVLSDKTMSLWASVSWAIPENYSIRLEDCTYVHSIQYGSLGSLARVISVWDGETCLSVSDTLVFLEELSSVTGVQLEMVPPLYEGYYDKALIHKIWESLSHVSEGYVIRPQSSFSLEHFSKVVGKFVRANHVTTDKHWRFAIKRLNK